MQYFATEVYYYYYFTKKPSFLERKGGIPVVKITDFTMFLFRGETSLVSRGEPEPGNGQEVKSHPGNTVFDHHMAEPGAGLTTEHRDLNEGRTSPDYATAESRILPSYVPVSGPQFPLHRAVFVPEDASQTSGDYGVPLHAADDRDEEVEYGQHEEEDHVAQQPNKDDSGGHDYEHKHFYYPPTEQHFYYKTESHQHHEDHVFHHKEHHNHHHEPHVF